MAENTENVNQPSSSDKTVDPVLAQVQKDIRGIRRILRRRLLNNDDGSHDDNPKSSISAADTPQVPATVTEPRDTVPLTTVSPTTTTVSRGSIFDRHFRPWRKRGSK